MLSPSQQLTDLICASLKDAKILNESSIESIKRKIIKGDIKSEDWFIAVENTLEANSKDEIYE